jgi:hypothetical protein
VTNDHVRKCRSVDRMKQTSRKVSFQKKFAERLASQDRCSAYFPLVVVPASKETLKNQRFFQRHCNFASAISFSTRI